MIDYQVPVVRSKYLSKAPKYMPKYLVKQLSVQAQKGGWVGEVALSQGVGVSHPQVAGGYTTTTRPFT